MLKTALIAAALCSVTSAFAANLVSNGSFEDDVVAAGTYSDLSSLSGGWTAGSGVIEVRNDLVGTAQDGVNYVELDSTGNSSMSQTLTTVIGETYELSFYYSNRAQSSLNGSLSGGIVTEDSNGLAYVAGGGIVIVTAQPTNTSSDNEWTLYTATFIATSTSTTLSFVAEGTSDSFGSSLDNVTVTAVPEPAELAMMGAGLLVVAGLARRRNRQA
jgi:hypothetical protein